MGASVLRLPAGTLELRPRGSTHARGVSADALQIRALIPGTCGGVACHTTRQKPTLANDDNLHRTLLDTVVEACGGDHLVAPGNPEASAILKLVHRECTKDGLPFFMPDDCDTNPCLPASQIRTIERWIEGGAPGE